MTDTKVPTQAEASRIDWPAMLVTSLVMIGLALTFRDGWVNMYSTWERTEEYSHGFLIPVVAFYLLWLRARQFGGLSLTGSWFGVFMTVGGIAGFVLGELSGIVTIIEYSLLFTLFGIVIAATGVRALRILWVPLVYLVFMVPLPDFLHEKLSTYLQLVSSEWGVAVIRFFGISVFLEGNVIDLGAYQLQVAEACNGLRYLFPLMSFGFLCAALYKGPAWQRVIIFLSAIPITVLMNSFRIGVIGVLVENFGIEQAEGFLHLFEGWIVFMACVGLLFLEMWFFNRISGSNKSLLQVFGLDVPPVDDLKALVPQKVRPTVLASLLVLGIGVVVSFGLQNRQDLIPEREPLSAFPLAVDDWTGRDKYVDKVFIDALKVDDHLMANYVRQGEDLPVELWIAYYDTQKRGQSAHSPRTCLPGGGWQIETLTQVPVTNVGPEDQPLTVNRAVIAKEEARQLVYYWFVERGRTVTNEYLVKLYIFWDALTQNRTDGALVRVTTYVPDKVMLDEADQRLQQFVRSLDPVLAYYLPQEQAAFRGAQATR